jgi:glucosylceramidase
MQSDRIKIAVFETSRRGGRFHAVPQDLIAQWNQPDSLEVKVQVQTDQRRQRITGFGGSFTDASAFLVHQMSPAQRQRILEAYFHEDGAHYSLTRTHMNSCDFSRR